MRYVQEQIDRRDAPPAPSIAPTEDVADQIRRFASLRDEGLLTPEEFEAKKTQLLGL